MVYNCKNCGHNFHGKFCNECGQKADVHRFTVKHILHYFFHAFTHVDSGLWFLIKELLVRPGVTVREYLNGRRKKYYNPFQFYLLTTAIMVFLTIKLDLAGLMMKVDFTGPNAQGVELLRTKFMIFFYQYFNIMQFVTLPMLSFFSYIFFRRSGFNYAENLVLNTFYSAERHIIYLLFIPFMYFFPAAAPTISRIYLIFWLAYFSWGYINFFKPKNKIWAVIKTIIILFLFAICIFIVVTIAFYILVGFKV